MQNCPCGSGLSYAQCCRIYHSQQTQPATPEALMRSRYTAYSLQKIDYIEKTMCGKAAEGFDLTEALQWSQQTKWQKLEVLSTKVNGQQGWVEFKAFYELNSQVHCLYEKSQFQLIDGRWYYVDGAIVKKSSSIVSSYGRNDACLCGSGKKYKKCCGY